MSKKKAFMLSRLCLYGSVLGFIAAFYFLINGANLPFFVKITDDGENYTIERINQGILVLCILGNFSVGIICGIFHFVYLKRSRGYSQAEENPNSAESRRLSEKAKLVPMEENQTKPPKFHIWIPGAIFLALLYMFFNYWLSN